jgi:digeranylgeranylglycerophospholipid reductase
LEVYDVIVIGAGPAGSTAARTLGDCNRKVLLLEKGPFPGRRKACGGMLPYQTFKEYSIDDGLIETTMEREIFIFPWSKRITSQRNVTVHRSIFDEHLASLAVKAGAELITPCRVTDVTREEDGQMHVKTVHGRRETSFQSSIVVFADGVNTLAHRTMGIGFRKEGCNVGFGIEYVLEAPANQLKDYFIFFGPKGLRWGYIWMFPNRDLLNVGICLLPQDLRNYPYREDILVHYTRDSNNELMAFLAGKKIVKRIGGFIPLEPASLMCCDSALAAGDAAGLVFPLTAGGIATAMYSGRLAAEVIDRALSEGDISRHALLQYESGIKNSGFHRTMKKESWMLALVSPLGHLDARLYAKLFQLWKLKGELSLLDSLKVLIYPFLGKLS